MNEDIKHLDPVDQQTVGGVFEELKQTHKKFEHLLYDLFSKKEKEDAKFLNKFIRLCTGQAYLPNKEVHPEFKITFEFNSTECNHDHIPSVHKCLNLIKIPASCYNLEMDVFLEKLETTIEFSAFGFDMV